MRKFIMLMMLPAFFACNITPESKSVVEFNLSNVEFEEARLSYRSDFVGYNTREFTATPNAEGYFSFETELPYPVMATITLGKKRISIYLEKAGQLTLTADMKDWDNTLAFEGPLANENEFLRQYNAEIAPKFDQQQTFTMYREASSVDFAHYAGQMFIEGTAYMDDWHRENPLSETFADYFSTDISYQVYRNLLNYPAYHTHFAGLEAEPGMPEDYYDFLEDAMDFSDDKLTIPSYAAFMNELRYYLHKKHNELIPEDLSDLEEQMWIVDAYYTGKTRFFVKAAAITSELNHGNFEKGEMAYNKFMEESTYEDFNANLTATYEKAYKVSPGQPAPGFTLTSIDGEEVSLDDFKGKVVYLDFWASWCGPCMREVPFAKELKKRFEGEGDLVFLYISVDEDDAAWRNTVDGRQIEGVHLNVKGMRQDIPQAYNVQGVPSFFIIDREGIILNNSPSRPSGDTIDEELKQALAG